MTKKSYWRIWNFINTTLRAWDRKDYLEVGGDGKICRMIKGNTEIIFDPEKMLPLPEKSASYVWHVSIEDFLLLWAVENKQAYAVILLREWDESNLEERVKRFYEILMDNGILIVEGFDKSGLRNDAWRIAGGLKKEGFKTGILRETFLCIYKGEPIEKSISLKIKKSTYHKNPEKYLP
jgi:hypothetical protein